MQHDIYTFTEVSCSIFFFKSYETNFTMKLTIMGSPGKGNPSSLVAVDNIIIKMATNKSRNVTNKGAEPEADFKAKVYQRFTT